MKHVLIAIIAVSIVYGSYHLSNKYLPQVRGTSSQVQKQIYEVKPLFGQTNSTPQSVNNKGTVIGFSYTQDNLPHAYVWQDKITFGVGSLGGNHSKATAINDSGFIVGISQSINKLFPHGFGYNKGNMQPLVSADHNEAYDINASGIIVGIIKPAQLNVPRAVFWQSFQKPPKLLGTLGGDFSQANAINTHGNITGISSLEINSTHKRAFIWYYGTPESKLVNLGTLIGGNFSEGKDINDTNEVVGYSETSNSFRAFKWSKANEMKNLGVLEGNTESKAFGINNYGYVVGISSKIIDSALCTLTSI